MAAPTVAGASGIDGASANVGTSVAVPYVGVAAGRRAYLSAYVRPETATLNTPSGWTLDKSRSGGTGTFGGGTGQGVLYVWEKDLDGSETGNVTVSGTGVDAVDGCMETVSHANGFAASVAVSGNDAVHDQNRSVTSDDGNLALAVDDLVLAFYGSDRGVNTAVTSPTLSQTSITFGTVTLDSEKISNTNNDATVLCASGAVTAGSGTSAPTGGFTTTATNCGPGIFVRVRAATPTPITLTDAGSGSDDITTSATAPLTDTGAGTDSIATTAAVLLVDTGTAADSLTATATVPLTDTGAADDLLAVLAQAALTEAGTALDALAVAAAASLDDTGTAAESLTTSAAVALTETGTGDDTLTVVVQVALTDAGSATETFNVLNPADLRTFTFRPPLAKWTFRPPQA